jgi:hypothetical protein
LTVSLVRTGETPALPALSSVFTSLLLSCAPLLLRWRCLHVTTPYPGCQANVTASQQLVWDIGISAFRTRSQPRANPPAGPSPRLVCRCSLRL